MKFICGGIRPMEKSELTNGKKLPAKLNKMGPALNTETVVLNVILRHPENVESLVDPLEYSYNDMRQKRLTHNDLYKKYGAHSDDIQKVENFAKEFNLLILDISREKRTVKLAGSVEHINKAFDVDLFHHEVDGKRYRHFDKEISIPKNLKDAVEGITGLSNTPVLKPFYHYNISHKVHSMAEENINQADMSLTPEKFAKYYNFPTNYEGSGQTIGVIEFGGGFSKDILDSYFKKLGMETPEIIDVGVGGKRNNFGESSADGEVMLDVEIIGTLAPKAKQIVYFADNSDSGFYDAVSAAVHDTVNKPSIISISWGVTEAYYNSTNLLIWDKLFTEAANLGITIFAASGDNGASDNTDSIEVIFPASHPKVIGCGGTMSELEDSHLLEIVWNNDPKLSATGGGVSNLFPIPPYQGNIEIPLNSEQNKGRGVPDVSGNASPGYQIYVSDENFQLTGGTSAVAPLWAALFARFNEQHGDRLGFVNPMLYELKMRGFNDITIGENGYYNATTGWDASTGLGTPNGTELYLAIKDYITNGGAIFQEKDPAIHHDEL